MEQNAEKMTLCVTESGMVTVTVCAAPGVSPNEVKAAMRQAVQDAEAAANYACPVCDAGNAGFTAGGCEC